MRPCDVCGKLRYWTPTGKFKQGRREWLCNPNFRGKIYKGCGHVQLEEPPRGVEKLPRILVYDIETSKALWNKYPSNRPQWLGYKDLVEEPYVMGWAAKWLDAPRIMSKFVTPQEAKERNDDAVVSALHKHIKVADILITYNGDFFDNKEMNARWARLGLPAISGYVSMDLYKKIKQVFRLPGGYSLANVARYFGCDEQKGHRENTDAAEAGDAAALRYDKKYCKQDILTTESVYYTVRSHIKTHPNLAAMLEMYQPLGIDERYCPRCVGVIGGAIWKKSYRTPAGNVYMSCNCPHCGAVVRKNEKHNKKMKTI